MKFRMIAAISWDEIGHERRLPEFWAVATGVDGD